MSSADDPDTKGELYSAAHRVLQCVDALTDLLSPPGGVGGEETQLKSLQHEVNHIIRLNYFVGLADERPDGFHLSFL